MIARRPDWPARMRALIAARLHAPFAWGSNDCALFAADAVLAQTDVDLAEGLRGLDARRAMRYVRREGGLAAIATKVLGQPSSLEACPGWILLCENGGRDLLAVWNGVVALAPGARGLVGIPLSAARAAWKL